MDSDSATSGSPGSWQTPLAIGFLANLLGLPAISVPIGVGAKSSLPVGLQLIGTWWQEATLLRLAGALDGDAAVPRPSHFFDELDALLL